MSNIYIGPDGVLDEKFKSLLQSVFDFLYKNIQDQTDFKPILHNGILLPSDVCDKFLDYFQQCNGEINDSLLEIFQNTQRTPLKYVNLRNSTISNHGKCFLFLLFLSTSDTIILPTRLTKTFKPSIDVIVVVVLS